MYFFGKLIPKTKIYVCSLFWPECKLFFQNCLQWGRWQFSWPCRVAENSFTKPGFWEDFVDFPQEKQQNTEFAKFSLVRTPQEI